MWTDKFPLFLSNLQSDAAFQQRVLDHLKGALWGLFIGDALAMPAHWYYDRSLIRRNYGYITTYEAPSPHFPNSIMNVSNIYGGGRDYGSHTKPKAIIGEVICVGKQKYWERRKSYHYHCTLCAGENTLEAQLVRLLLRSLIAMRKLDSSQLLQEYVSYMQTPNAYNDAYAGTSHRIFFMNLMQGKHPLECAGNDGHNVDAIDGLTNILPMFLLEIVPLFTAGVSTREERVNEFINLFRKSDVLAGYAMRFGDMFMNTFVDVCLNDQRSDSVDEVSRGTADVLQSNAEACARSMGFSAREMSESTREDPMVACYIRDSFSAALYFVHKYANCSDKYCDSEAGNSFAPAGVKHSSEGRSAIPHDETNPLARMFSSILQRQTNAGGENVARGSLLGAIVGGAVGEHALPKSLVDGLVVTEALRGEIDSFSHMVLDMWLQIRR